MQTKFNRLVLLDNDVQCIRKKLGEALSEYQSTREKVPISRLERLTSSLIINNTSDALYQLS